MRRRGHVWLRRAWESISAVSVRSKIMGIILGLVLLLGAGVTVHVRVTTARDLSHELDHLGISIARDLAARSINLILTKNLFSLHELLRDTVSNNEDLRYAFLLNTEGQVLVHSFDRGVPPGLLAVNTVRSDERYRLQILDTEDGLIHDVAVPIFEGRAGTARVGLSEHRLQARLAATTRQLALITLLVSLVGVMGGFLLTWVLTRPVKVLVEMTRAVARGDLTQRAPRWADDEIGDLSISFNEMVEELVHAQKESETYNRMLLRRHQELAATASVAQAVSSGQLDLHETLERALKVVLEVTGLQAGWIMLLAEDGKKSSVGGWAGLPSEVVKRESEFRFPRCECSKAIESRTPIVVPLVYPDCPARAVLMSSGQPPTCHATVPLLTRSRVLGVINILSDDAASFLHPQLRLLGALGRQLGVAIENARLWQELKQRETARGQLLKQVITAQEEERRRIARELHDETSQSLASLMVGLKAAQEALSVDPARSGEILNNLRASVSETVKEVHNIVYDLRPTLLDDLGLIPALRWYLESRLKMHSIDVDFVVEGQARRMPSEVETVLFRIAQEAVTNILRHAGASQVWVTLRLGTEGVAIHVRDNGQGFAVGDTLDTGDGRQGLGLLGIQERAALLGGACDVRSKLEEGTELRVWMPLSLAVGEHGKDTDPVGR